MNRHVACLADTGEGDAAVASGVKADRGACGCARDRSRDVGAGAEGLGTGSRSHVWKSEKQETNNSEECHDGAPHPLHETNRVAYRVVRLLDVVHK